MKRFWDKVNKNTDTGCWEWIGGKRDGRYGAFKLNGKNYRPHRLVYEWFNNKKIPNNLLICHKCDNPKCVNPEHLFLGTNQDNADDMVKKGRSSNGDDRKGENNLGNKLKNNDVLEIRKLIKEGLTNIEIAKKYNVHHATISLIRLEKTWNHI